MVNSRISEVFEHFITLPDIDAQYRLGKLVGLDDKIRRLSNLLAIRINTSGLKEWLDRYHAGATDLLGMIQQRPPLVVLSGDVGTGKTELARNIGDMVARQEKIEITLLPVSLSSRGQGRVGEMTQLISAAFDYALSEAEKVKPIDGNHARGGIILLIDEADALAQSREENQMHHEDRAGVNAFIRGIDRFAQAHLPIIVLMCTNRLSALDPAVRRRAADILVFERPNEARRREVFNRYLNGIDIRECEMQELLIATGEQPERSYGFTYSDIVQRLLPTAMLDAYPNRPIIASRIIELAHLMVPTVPFRET